MSDRLRRRKPVLLALAAVYCVSWLPWVLGASMPTAASLTLCFAMGVAGSAFTLTLANAKEVNRRAFAGMAVSLVNTGVFLGAAILQPLVGWILDRASGGAGAQAAGPDEFRIAIGGPCPRVARRPRGRFVPARDRLPQHSSGVTRMKPKVLITRDVFDEVTAYLLNHFDVIANPEDEAVGCRRRSPPSSPTATASSPPSRTGSTRRCSRPRRA